MTKNILIVILTITCLGLVSYIYMQEPKIIKEKQTVEKGLSKIDALEFEKPKQDSSLKVLEDEETKFKSTQITLDKLDDYKVAGFIYSSDRQHIYLIPQKNPAIYYDVRSQRFFFSSTGIHRDKLSTAKSISNEKMKQFLVMNLLQLTMLTEKEITQEKISELMYAYKSDNPVAIDRIARVKDERFYSNIYAMICHLDTLFGIEQGRLPGK